MTTTTTVTTTTATDIMLLSLLLPPLLPTAHNSDVHTPGPIPTTVLSTLLVLLLPPAEGIVGLGIVVGVVSRRRRSSRSSSRSGS